MPCNTCRRRRSRASRRRRSRRASSRCGSPPPKLRFAPPLARPLPRARRVHDRSTQLFRPAPASSLQLVAISASGVVFEGDAKRAARRAALPREAPAHSSRTNRSVHWRSVHCARDRSRLLTLYRYPNAYIETYIYIYIIYMSHKKPACIKC